MTQVKDLDSNLFWDGVIDIPRVSWIFTEEYLEKRTPSRTKSDPKKRVPFPDEILKRIKGVFFIFNSCRYLKLSRSVAMTASTLLHRFYMKNDILSYHYYEVGTACLFIACKAEECRRKLSDVIKVCARIATGGREIIDEESKIYWQWKDLIVKLEETMLQVFEFDVSPTNPYKMTAQVLDIQLDPNVPSTVDDPEWKKRANVLFGHCINYCELLVRLPLTLLYPVEVICGLGLVLAAKKADLSVPKNIFNDKLGVTSQELIQCHSTIIKLGSIANRADKAFQILPFLPTLTQSEIEMAFQ